MRTVFLAEEQEPPRFREAEPLLALQVTFEPWIRLSLDFRSLDSARPRAFDRRTGPQRKIEGRYRADLDERSHEDAESLLRLRDLETRKTSEQNGLRILVLPCSAILKTFDFLLQNIDSCPQHTGRLCPGDLGLEAEYLRADLPGPTGICASTGLRTLPVANLLEPGDVGVDFTLRLCHAQRRQARLGLPELFPRRFQLRRQGRPAVCHRVAISRDESQGRQEGEAEEKPEDARSQMNSEPLSMRSSSTDEEWHERLYDIDRDRHEAQDLPLEHRLALSDHEHPVHGRRGGDEHKAGRCPKNSGVDPTVVTPGAI